ncbi:hypothetical protein Loa_01695 [Legionella oakridgensis ATCC 33761 = DSM 21215]|uniref:Proline utilization A proline dehydrogenase N-terminal domain-containing protein n=1 Tax=Legionella oakridgensis ATCC 33761 = DSM 21215 TaxID=1268635 RepID=W0BF50_9GAMM|nr:hypothetical protein [Legionella oakridgensis]AHE67242.1 hypothetical protein Loa_01695 [Legionella oakridgensis ATCC 33761 = DSM 21215]
MLDRRSLQPPQGLRATINDAYRETELKSITRLIEYASLDEGQVKVVQGVASRLVEAVRRERKKVQELIPF